jgi:hypothetical protein
VTQQVAAHMKNHGIAGSIININSVNGAHIHNISEKEVVQILDSNLILIGELIKQLTGVFLLQN